jgi:CRISPR-associated protein Cmr6
MSIAAVPAYLGKDFKDASPGLRFGLLLPIWTTRQDQETQVNNRALAKSREGQEVVDMLQRQGMEATITSLRKRERNPLPGLWDKNDFAARGAWNDITALSQSDKARMKALGERQNAVADNTANLLSLDALAIAPFATGLGNEHPLENGFAFLNPYGLPYLPASGVKGVLRQAARELASGDWGEAHGWSAEKRYPLLQGEGEKRKPMLDRQKQPIMLSMLDMLFGHEAAGNDTSHLHGVLTFWDVIPQIKGDSLMVEIMTPHQGHYYQQKAHAGSTNPHDSGSPNPISFLTVPPGSGFNFHVQCNLPFLQHLAPDLAKEGRWKTLLEAAFSHAFAWLGFGAKTAVGYGAMTRDEEAEAKAEKARAAREREAVSFRQATERENKFKAMTANQRSVEQFKDACASRVEQLRGGKDRQNTDYHQRAQKLVKDALAGTDWTPEEKCAVADAITEWLPKVVERIDRDALKKLKVGVLRGTA